MSTIVTIQSTDLITNSRADINTNFSNLNTDKIETSTLDTDTTLAANSDAKIATQKAVKAYVDAGGNVNASETARGIVEEATDAETTAGTATGGTGAKLFVTPAKLATFLSTGISAPVIRSYTTAATNVGSSTTQFDITNTSGTTFRYTYDGTGTDPSFSSVNYPVGTPVYFNAQNFSAGNNGVFLVTNSGTNFVEVTNASGVAENNKTIGTQYVIKGVAWTKPASLKYIMVEMVGSGGGGGGANSATGGSGGGGSGAYSRKIIAAASLGAKEGVIVGIKGAGGSAGSNNGSIGKPSVFGNLLLYAAGGAGGEFNPGGSNAAGGQGGSAINGDVNLDGGIGGNGLATDAGSNRGYSGYGGVSYFGGGGPAVGITSGATGGQTSLVSGGGGSGAASQSGSVGGGDGAPGIVILTEYYA